MPGRITITLKGDKELIRLLDRLGDQAPLAAAVGLYNGAQRIFSRSQGEAPVGGPPTSPRDPHRGALRGSGHVTGPTRAGKDYQVTIGYGGAARAYALAQHRRTDFRHKPGQKAHFLEDPMREGAPYVEGLVKQSVSEAVKKL